MKTYIFSFLTSFLIFAILNIQAQNPVPKENFWQTDQSVDAIAYDSLNNLVYIGGTFRYIGPSEPHGGSVQKETGVVDFAFANPNGTVWVAIADGNGGWYIGGDFTEVGGQTRNRLAQINAAGQLMAWNPNVGITASSTIRAMVLADGIVYVGGFFASIGGQERKNVAGINAVSGLPTPWNPSVFGDVESIAVSPTTIYIGGKFSNIGVQIRNRIASFDRSTGALTNWNPNANDSFLPSIRALSLQDTVLYVGGKFTSIGGQNRTNLAAIDVNTGLANGWNPVANQAVNAMAISGVNVYVGGLFTAVGGTNRNYLAALDANTGLATAWQPTVEGELFQTNISSLAIDGPTLYAGGSFNSISGQNRSQIAAIDTATALPTSWNPGANSWIRTIAFSEASVYLGGSFTSIGGGSNTRNIAAIDANTGMPTSWNPDLNGWVRDIALSGSTVYVAGDFTAIGGENRNKLGAIDANTGEPTSWNPDVNGSVYCMNLSESTLYIGGSFTEVGGQTRNRIAAIDRSTGLAKPWNPNANNLVRSLVRYESKIYAGGDFTNIGGVNRNRIAALDTASNSASTWNPNANNRVYTLAILESTLYVGGDFTGIGAQNRQRLAAFDASTGLITPWNPSANATVLAIAPAPSSIIVGGNFATANGMSRSRIASFDTATGQLNSWNPDADGSVDVITVSDSWAYVGGNFNSIGGKSRRAIAAFDLDPCYIPALEPVLVNTDPGTCEAAAVMLDTPATNVDCTVASVSNDAPAAFPLGTTTVNWTVTYTSGHTATATQIVTVTDGEAPAITCPQPVVVNNDPNFCGNVVNYTLPTGSDNCSDVAISQTAGLGSGATFPLGVSAETFIIIDALGNTNSCTFTVTVVDVEAPVAVCSNIDIDLGESDYIVLSPGQLGAGSTDNCGIASITLNRDTLTFEDFGLQEVLVTVTDLSGNTNTCTAEVNFTPVVPPCTANGGTLSAPANRSFCVGTGELKELNVSVSGASGSNQAFALTNNATGDIVATRSGNSRFNLDSYPPGNYSIRYIRYEAGVAVGSVSNIAQVASLEGCYSLASNAIGVFLRSTPEAGTLIALSPTSVCADAGPTTIIQVGLAGNDAENLRYGLVSAAQSNMLIAASSGTSTGHTFNLNGRPAGTYRVAAIGYQAGVSFEGVQFANQVQGCFDLSNFITVNITNCLAAKLEASPNPTSGTSFVTFTNPRDEYSTLEVYDLSGRMVERLFEQTMQAGQSYRIGFNAGNLPNGVYLYRLTTQQEVVVERFMLAR